MAADVLLFEKQQGITFLDKALLQHAFVHRSYVNESGEESGLKDNERLEFLGDTILGYIVSEELFRRYPEYQEGQLTSIRSALVRRETLARLATQMNMGDFLLLGHGEEESGGRQRTATLCAVFEALVGAMYMDQGIEFVRSFLVPIISYELARVHHAALEKDAKSRLQEYVQSHMNVTPRYRMVDAAGPDHAKTFTMRVMLADIMYGVGYGHSKQDATQQAAAMALHRLGQYAPEYDPDPELIARFTWPPLPTDDEDAEGTEHDDASIG